MVIIKEKQYKKYNFIEYNRQKAKLFILLDMLLYMELL